MDFIFTTGRYLGYLLSAKSPHGVHSPFVFDFVNNLLRDRTPYYAFGPLETARKNMMADNRTVSISDYGAGSEKTTQKQLPLKTLVGRQTLPLHYARLMFRLVNRFQPQNILEMGTSVGLTTLHMAAANKKARIVTLEGSPGTAAVARELLSRYKAKNVEVRVGEFSHVLPGSLKDLGRIDFLYLDGNHRLAPTLDYFERILPHCHEGTIMVLDDIHWSREMEEAWNRIRHHERVTLSIDLFRMGLIFFHSGRRREHFTLKF